MNFFKIVKYVVVLAVLSALVVAVAVYHFSQKVHLPVQLDVPMVYSVKKGQSANRLLNQLKSSGILQDSLGLKIHLKFNPELANIKVGSYELLPSMTGLDVLKLFVSGKEIQFSISLIEGLRWRDWLKTINNHPKFLDSQISAADVDRFLQSSAYNSIEGVLMPDTYHFTPQTKSLELIKRAYQQMHDYLEQAWLSRDVGLPYETPYEALIMASIIEKETGVAAERPRIAGVFVNRLHKNMRLQTDPTVIYGMGEAFDGDIRRKDLRTATPYNTYVIKGLPPTPIAMPSKLAIDAAMHPLETDELYFVAKGDGSHYFSVTLQQHNKAVRKYILNK